MNLKRLTTHTQAAGEQAAGPASGQIAPLSGHEGPIHVESADQIARHASPAAAHRIALAAPTAWTITLSLN